MPSSEDELDSFVAAIDSLGILETQGVEQEEISSFLPVMSQLGYAQLKFVQGPPTDSSHLTLAGQFRHSSVIIRINKSPNTARLAFQDIAHHDAYFLLKCSSEFGAVFTQTPVQTDENASPADVLHLKPQSGGHFSISNTLRGDFLAMKEFLVDLQASLGAPETPWHKPVEDFLDVLFQVLKLYDARHRKGFVLLIDPSRLMLWNFQDGQGSQAVPRLRFMGRSLALIVVTGSKAR